MVESILYMYQKHHFSHWIFLHKLWGTCDCPHVYGLGPGALGWQGSHVTEFLGPGGVRFEMLYMGLRGRCMKVTYMYLINEILHTDRNKKIIFWSAWNNILNLEKDLEFTHKTSTPIGEKIFFFAYKKFVIQLIKNRWPKKNIVPCLRDYEVHSSNRKVLLHA